MSGTATFTKTDSPTAPGAGQVSLSFPSALANRLQWIDAAGTTNTLDGRATLSAIVVFETNIVTNGGEIVWQT